MLISVVVCASVAPIALYASVRGNDSWPGTASRPFRTLDRLQEQVLRVRSSGDMKPIVVKLSGRFVLDKPWELGAEFSEVTVDGQDKTALDGGYPLTDWTKDRFGDRDVLAASVPRGYYRQLFVRGERRPRATLPKQGFYQLVGLLNGAEKGPWNVGQDAARFKDHDIRPFANVADVEFVAHHYWIQSRMRMKRVDESAHVVEFDRKSVFRLTDDYAGGGAPYRLENVPEGLSDPGDWYFYEARSQILYLPKHGEVPRSLDAWVGRIPVLLTAEHVRGLVLKGISFEHAEWQPPVDSAGDVQAAVGTPAVIQLRDAKNCKIANCAVRHCGNYGLEIAGGSATNTVEACDFVDLGGGGVKVGHGTEHTTVADCVIERCGRIFAPSVGVWIGDSGGNLISHNRIHDLYYTGVSVGWVWGYGASLGSGNVIEYNDIADIGQGQLSDMGGIYTLGVSPGTVISHNRIRNVDARGYGGWGIYLDEGSTGINVTDNLVENVKTGSFHQHYGQENLIHNNVFLNARTAGQLIRSRAEDHRSFSIEQNAIVWKNTDLLGSNWEGNGFQIDRNVYWRTDAQPVLFAGKSLSDWQALGHDTQSLVADPLMTVNAKGVRFRKNSPARKLGIENIDLSTVGPRR